MNRRATDRPASAAALRQSTTLWRMRSAAGDNQASCTIVENEGCEILIVFAKGFAGVSEHFPDVTTAMQHALEMAQRLAGQGWTEIESD